MKGLGLGTAVMGVGALIGGVAGLTSGGLAGGFAGLLTPSAGSLIGAGALAAPAAWGMFDPSAAGWAKSYATGYAIAGSIGNFGRAVTTGSLYAHWSDGIAEGSGAPGKFGAAAEIFGGAMRWVTATSAMAGAVSLMPLALRGAEEGCRERSISGGIPCF